MLNNVTNNRQQNDLVIILFFFFFSSRRRHTRSKRDWSSDVCSSDLDLNGKSIATSYPNILKKFLKEHNLQADIKLISGSVEISRSEERRVGKECRSRWSTYHKKKKKKI